MFCLLYGPKFSQCRCDISWGMFIFTRLMFSINFKPQTLKVYFFVYISRIYTSKHIHILYIVCFFRTWAWKRHKSFLPQSSLWETTMASLLITQIPNDQTVTNPDQEKGTARRVMPRRWISWRVLSEVSFRSANVFFFHFFRISICLLYLVAGALLPYHGCLWPGDLKTD